MAVIVNTSKGPPAPKKLRDEDLEKIKVVMSNRYDIPNKHLDLDALYHDPEFKREGVSVQLSRFETMAAVCKIIEENIPEVIKLLNCSM